MVADKAKQAASAMLEVAPEDLELIGGDVRVKGSDLKRSLGEIAHALSGVAGFSLPAGITPGLAAATDYQPPAITYTNGTHVVEGFGGDPVAQHREGIDELFGEESLRCGDDLTEFDVGRSEHDEGVTNTAREPCS
jgi:hypothetical protein